MSGVFEVVIMSFSFCRERNFLAPSSKRAAAAVFLLITALPLFSASSGTTGLHTPQGSGAATANGDYVTGGLDTLYSYFIEVPPGLGRLTVEVFDPDIGVGGAAEAGAGRDRARNGFDSTANYALIRPDGTTAATLNGCDDNTCSDNAWQTILNSTTAQNTAAGHWELRVDMRSSVTNGDDINAIGIRAHDGTSGSGGTELRVYYDSQANVGINPPGSGTVSRSYSFYPYVTSGCSASKNDFDFDSNSGSTGSIALTSRNGSFTQNYAGTSFSGDDVWRRDTFSGWTSDQLATGYGIWSETRTITSYVAGGTPNGNYANVWYGNFSAAANPPAANPTANAFRVYLPSDAGTAPVKPYLEQLLTFKSGTLPVPVGQTGIFQVTVRLVNPTPQSITFSAANLVTANVPGGGATYNGNAAVSQGSITGQPAVNATGNVTWNPGTVGAGVTALLTYQVRVTPTSAGQRIVVTATPASGNGTRARYVDETGNTTQGRATFTFGPLCELATTQGLLTRAVVSSLGAFRSARGGVEVEWRTASEAGTAGFYLYRWDAEARRYRRVNERLLAGLQGSPQGGVYRLHDREATGGRQRYLVEEVEAGGGRSRYGPFVVRVAEERPGLELAPLTLGEAGTPAGAALETEGSRAPHPAAGRSQAAAKDGEAPQKPRGLTGLIAPPIPPSSLRPAGLHLSVSETGLYYLSAEQIAGWLGVTALQAQSLLGKGNLALSRKGEPVAWRLDAGTGLHGGARGLYFYGESAATAYDTSTAYRLAPGFGLWMDETPAAPAAPVSGGSFAASAHTEQDLFAATALPLNPDSDYWFWSFLQGGEPAYERRTYSLEGPGALAGEVATLRVGLQGATSSGVAGEHRARVSLNGVPVGETQWEGISARVASFPVPAGALLAAGNQVEVEAAVGAGAPYSIFYVDAFDLDYRRSYRAAGDTLTFAPDGASPVTVSGFSTPALAWLDIRNSLRPRWLTGILPGNDPESGGAEYRASFEAEPGARYLVAPTAPARAVEAIREWSPASLRSASNRAGYLVVAPAGWEGAAEQLAELRRRQGLEARVVGLDQIADEFNDGDANPAALRAFLTWARSEWSVPPRYVALAGAGTVDYRDLLGLHDNFLPPLMVRTADGLFPSDNRLGDADADGLPDVAVGRIPVSSPAELSAYVAKIAAFEAAPEAPWTGRGLFLSDATDHDADFTAQNEEVAAQAPSALTLDRVSLASVPLAEARAQTLAAFAEGRAWINYLGHGGLDRLSGGGLLASADVESLANGARLPVVTAMTCTVNRFSVPGVPALGELLVARPGGGAAAVWGPTGLSLHGEAKLLAERFYRTMEAPLSLRLGDRILRAMSEYRELGGDPALLDLYSLLGDPALLLHPLPEAPPAGAGASEE